LLDPDRAPHQHPPTRPPGFTVPVVEGIVSAHGPAKALVCDGEVFAPWVVALEAAPVA
jgi:hypothetical protein